MKCHFCKESGFAPEEGKEFHSGWVCEFCSTNCGYCGDWLGNETETIIDGQRWHKMCAEDCFNAAQQDLPFENLQRENVNG